MYKLLSAVALGCCLILVDGVPVEQLKIIGGHNVTIEQYPYQASIQVNDRRWCAGAIISTKHVITSELCLTNKYRESPGAQSVRVGSSHYNKGGKEYKVANLFFRGDPLTSIIELSEPIVFGAGVQKIELASPYLVIKDGMKAVVTGWGSYATSDPLADQLQAVELTTLSAESCKSYYYPFLVSYDHFCAFYQQSGNNAAKWGDDVGPLVSSNVLIGISPLMPGCGLFYNIANMRRFIDPIISNA